MVVRQQQQQQQHHQVMMEHLAKALFLQVDPILRLLLTVLNSYQKKEYLQVVSSSSSSSTTTTSSSSSCAAAATSQDEKQLQQQKQHERQLGMLQMQAQLLDRLQATLVAFQSQQQRQQPAVSVSVSSSPDEEEEPLVLWTAQSILLLLEYMSLPLLTILRMSSHHDTTTTAAIGGNNNEIENTDYDDDSASLLWTSNLKNSRANGIILQSAIYKVWTKTALLIQWIVEATTISQPHASGQSSSSSCQLLSTLPSGSSCSLTVEMQTQFLVACASVLPSGKQIIQIRQQQQQQQQQGSLDRGEECLGTVLQTLRVLVQNIHEDHDNDDEQGRHRQAEQLLLPHDRANQIVTTMNGALLARVVDSCMALIAPPPPPPPSPTTTTNSCPSSPIWNNHQNSVAEKQNDDCCSVSLQLQALETLQAWMNLSIMTTTTTTTATTTRTTPRKAVVVSRTPSTTTSNITTALVLWRRFFPGCFSGLYRRLLSALRTTRQSSRLAVATIRALSLLLRLTLLLPEEEEDSRTAIRSGGSSDPKTTIRNKDIILASLQSLSAKATSQAAKAAVNKEQVATNLMTTTSTTTAQDGSGGDDDKSKDESTIFFAQVLERLPGPLLTLVHLLSVNSSCAVRLVTVEHLLHVLIQITSMPRHGRCPRRHDTVTSADSICSGSSNINSNNNNNTSTVCDWSLELQTTVLDSCVMFSRDHDSDVALAANRILLPATTTTTTTTISSSSSTGIGDIDSTSCTRMVPGMIINRLETLLTELHGQVVMGQQQHRQVELRAHFQYITGYLYFGTTMALTNKRTRKELKASLLMLLEEENSQVRRCLLQELFRVDANRLQDATVLVGSMNRATVPEETSDQIVVVMDPHASAPTTPTSAELRWYPPLCRSLDHETLPLAVEMVRLLGTALGPKSSAVLIDGVVAELFQTAIVRQEQQQKQQAQQQFRNMSLSLSSLRLETDGSSRNNGKIDIDYADEEATGFLRFCQELLIGAFDNNQSESSEKCERVLFSLAAAIVPVLLSPPLFQFSAKSNCSTLNNDTKGSTKNEGETAESAATSLRREGQVCRTLALLDLTQSIFVRLRPNNGRDLLPVAVYPILLSRQDVDCNVVREMATFALEQISVGCVFTNLSLMMAFCMPSLVSTIIGKLRLLQGGRLSSSASSVDSMGDGLISIVKTTTAMLQMTISSLYQDDELSCNGLENAMQVVAAHLDRFDHVLSVISVDANLASSFLELYEATLLHLFAWLDNKTKKSTVQVELRLSEESQSKKAVATWLTWLPKTTKKRLRLETGRGTFFDHDDDDSNETESGINKDVPERQEVNGLVSLYETNFVASILRRASYLLAHESLAVQLWSCRALIKGFSFLGRVTSLSHSGDESNGAYNAILRHSAESWPTVCSRLKATVSVLPMSNKVTSLVIKSTMFSPESAGNFKTHGQARLYLVQLTGLIVEMTVNAGDDFMASRLKEHVWPCLMQILRSYDGDKRGVERSLLLLHGTIGRSSSRDLLVAVIRCFERIFGFRPVGLALSGLIPTSAAPLFPLLNFPDVLVATAAMDALKAMILIDCDALRRPLWEMTATPLPRSPFLPVIRKTPHPSDKLSKSPLGTVASSETQELVDFINSLPEQEVE